MTVHLVLFRHIWEWVIRRQLSSLSLGFIAIDFGQSGHLSGGQSSIGVSAMAHMRNFDVSAITLSNRPRLIIATTHGMTIAPGCCRNIDAIASLVAVPRVTTSSATKTELPGSSSVIISMRPSTFFIVADWIKWSYKSRHEICANWCGKV